MSSISWSTLAIYSLPALVSLVMSTVVSFWAYTFEEEIWITKCHDDRLAMQQNSASLKDDDGDADSDNEDTPESSFQVFAAPFIYYCALGFEAALGEISMVTWLVIYYQRYLTDSTLLASMGFSVFMLLMAFGRFAGDSVRSRYGRRKLVRACGLLLLVGLVVLVAAPSLAGALGLFVGTMGCALVGAGLSVLIPTVFSSAGHMPGVNAGKAISIAASFTYTGSIVAPFFVGGLSGGFHSLRAAFAVDTVCLSAVFLLSYKIPPDLMHMRLLRTTSTDPREEDDPREAEDALNRSNAVLPSHAEAKQPLLA